jgi:hypothetical protein
MKSPLRRALSAISSSESLAWSPCSEGARRAGHSRARLAPWRRCHRKIRLGRQFEFKALTGFTTLTARAAMRIARKPAASSSAQAIAYVDASKGCTPKT